MTVCGPLLDDTIVRSLRRAAAVLLAVGTAFSMASAGALAASPTDAFRAHRAGATGTIDHSAWTKLLATYVVPGRDGINRVDYRAFKADGHATLKTYVARLEAVDPATLDRPEQFAFWANLYNAKTIDVVLDAYPVASIREISIGGGFVDLLKQSVGAGGPWTAKVLTVTGMSLSLDDIEHAILRPIFADPRVHYAVNCASIGCPNLGTRAWTGATLEADLDAAARAFVNHPRGLRVEGDKVTASSIYSWFAADFGGSPAAVIEHARRFAAPQLKDGLAGQATIDDYQYDWSLNDVTAPRS